MSRSRRRALIRRLTADEKAFARQVFGDDADWLDTVVLTRAIGWQRRAFVLPLGRRLMLVNLGRHMHDPVAARTPAYPVSGQLLVHELVHVWQFRHCRSIPRLLGQAIGEQLRYLRGGDVYGLAAGLGGWQSLTMEQQATAVDRWFAGALPRDSPLFHTDDALPIDGADPAPEH